MATNLDIDDNLISRAAELGNHRTKKAAVTEALIQYIQHLEQQEILSMFGSVVYEPGHDHKKQRRRP